MRRSPTHQSFDPAGFLATSEETQVSCIETKKDPQQFRVISSGPEGKILQRLDLDDPIQRRGFLMELLECIATRQPMYQEIRTMIGGQEEHYWRLFLPVADTDGDVVTVHAVYRPVKAITRERVDFAAMLP